jgi:sugar phosphate isomerase/epimerase
VSDYRVTMPSNAAMLEAGAAGVVLRRELDEARAEIRRLTPPPGASAYDLAKTILTETLGRPAFPPTIETVARAIELAGEPLRAEIRRLTALVASVTDRANVEIARLTAPPDAPTDEDIAALVRDLVDIAAQRGINMGVTAPPGASALERARHLVSSVAWASMGEAVARAIEQAEREGRAAAIEEAARIAEGWAKDRPHLTVTASMIAKAIRALAAAPQ